MLSPYLTEVQQKEWQKEGFLIIKNVLSPEEIQTLLASVDSVIETYVQETPSLQGNNRFGKGAYTIIRAIERTDALRPTHRPSTYLRHDPLVNGSLSPDYGNADLRPTPRCRCFDGVSYRCWAFAYNGFIRMKTVCHCNSKSSFS